jgi:hypothetical protein
MIKDIPVSRHIKSFLTAEFGPEPIAIHQNTFLGSVILLVAEKSPYRQCAPKLNTEKLVTIKVKLPVTLKHRTISPESLKSLGVFFDKLFRQQFIMYMKGQVKITNNEYHAICSFYKDYQINPDDLDLETLRKVWRDYKEKVYRSNTRLVAA